MLLTLDNVLSADELSIARQLLAEAHWASGQITAGPQAAMVKNNQQLSEEAPQLPALRHLVLQALSRSAQFFAAALPLKILPPFFNRYSGQSNSYGFHTDNAMRLVPGQPGAYVRSDVSATLFLSEPESYEGGVLTIDDTFGQHGVKCKAGSLVLYPSSSLHAVSPVTSGERLCCFMFLQSMVPDAGQRRLLFDMDMALLQLRQDLGEAPAVVQLTGTYHNLLRRWAQT
ncbi:Fe2+-dependent dioxygenase [Rhodoferax lacus]|uniref:Fe2+-dependent dioxygenase n=1 Tax=Rhodoferax lacus TaxID=2184758 RepID=A0A3E1RFI8_9BURK|nr:Fe2+-dependent dioxygenase [Rhodoferax lacus]RFO98134.1 Fe2+-dependent dioxygenase [Rhodoferax lacus]